MLPHRLPAPVNGDPGLVSPGDVPESWPEPQKYSLFIDIDRYIYIYIVESGMGESEWKIYSILMVCKVIYLNKNTYIYLIYIYI